MSLRVEFRPLALGDLEEAVAWYDERTPVAGGSFREEIAVAIDKIVENPERWPNHHQGTRRYTLKRFPFFVVYRLHNAVIEIIAVAHHARGPGYWRRRLRK